MGQNKALMPFLGQPLIERIARRLANIADEMVVVSNTPDDFSFLRLPVFDDLKPGLGSLGGLFTALSVARQPFVAVVACDMPFVSARLLAAQLDLLIEGKYDVVIPRSSEGLEPLHSVYRQETCLPAIAAAINAGERRMISWFPAVRVRELKVEEITRYDPPGRAFVNVNTPEEFRLAEKLAHDED